MHRRLIAFPVKLFGKLSRLWQIKLSPKLSRIDQLEAHLVRNGFRRVANEVQAGGDSFFSQSLRRLSNLWFDHRVYSRLNKVCMDKIEIYAIPERKDKEGVEICARREWREGGVIAQTNLTHAEYLERCEKALLLLDMAGPLDQAQELQHVQDLLQGQGTFKFTWSDGFQVRQQVGKN